MLRLTVPAALALIAVIAFVSQISFAAFDRGGDAGQAGSYPVQLNLQSDICQHDQYIFPDQNPQTPPHNRTLLVSRVGQIITVSGPNPWVTVAGDIDNNYDFTANGVGTVAGFQNIKVSFLGHLENGVLTGTYAFGSSNDLPECMVNGHLEPHPAVYQVKAKPATATPTPTGPRTPPQVPPSNGTCTQTGTHVDFDGEAWDWAWKCSETESSQLFTRVDISIGASGGQPMIDGFAGGLEVKCQSTTEIIDEPAFKGRRPGANPEEPLRPDHEVWSAVFATPCSLGVTAYFDTVNHVLTTIKAVAFTDPRLPTETPTPTETAHPTPVLTENGNCIQVRVDVPIGNVLYDEWKCSEHDVNFSFNRVDIAVEAPISFVSISPPIFRCQSGLGNQEARGAFKGFRVDVNPGSAPDDMIWSAEFPGGCTEGVSVFVHSTILNDPHALVKRVAFTTVTIPTATATPPATNTAPPPQPTPTVTHTATLPPPTHTPTRTPIRFPTPVKVCGDVNDDGDINSIDDTLLLQYVVRLTDHLPNPFSADTNHDGRINSVDGVIILQIDAGLLDHCGEVM